MKLSFATLGCPAWNMRQIVDNAKTMGLDGVELRGVAGEHIGPEETAESRAAIKKMFADAGVSVACIMGYSRFTWDDQAKRRADIDAAKKMLAVAKDVGCPTLRLFGGQLASGNYRDNLGRVVESLRELAPVATRLGVRIALETHDDWCRGENIRDVLAAVGSPAVGVCWDIANASFIEPFEKTFPFIKDHIYHVHFKDAARDASGAIHSKLPGLGQVNMKEGLRLIKSAGYDGWLSFEWEKKWEPALEEPEVAFPHYLRHAMKVMGEVGVKRG